MCNCPQRGHTKISPGCIIGADSVIRSSSSLYLLKHLFVCSSSSAINNLRSVLRPFITVLNDHMRIHVLNTSANVFRHTPLALCIVYPIIKQSVPPAPFPSPKSGAYNDNGRRRVSYLHFTARPLLEVALTWICRKHKSISHMCVFHMYVECGHGGGPLRHSFFCVPFCSASRPESSSRQIMFIFSIKKYDAFV